MLSFDMCLLDLDRSFGTIGDNVVSAAVYPDGEPSGRHLASGRPTGGRTGSKNRETLALSRHEC
jgi:hypothetical protein